MRKFLSLIQSDSTSMSEVNKPVTASGSIIECKYLFVVLAFKDLSSDTDGFMGFLDGRHAILCRLLANIETYIECCICIADLFLFLRGIVCRTVCCLMLDGDRVGNFQIAILTVMHAHAEKVSHASFFP